jgi:hypothetical protein
VCDTAKEFDRMLDRKAQRDEALFSDVKHGDDEDAAGAGKDKQGNSGVVTH